MIKDYNLQKFIAITLRIKESRCSGTLKKYVVLLLFCFYYISGTFVFVKFAYAVNILASEKRAYCDIGQIHWKHRNIKNNDYMQMRLVMQYIASDVKRTWINFSILSLVSTDLIILERVPPVLDIVNAYQRNSSLKPRDGQDVLRMVEYHTIISHIQST